MSFDELKQDIPKINSVLNEDIERVSLIFPDYDNFKYSKKREYTSSEFIRLVLSIDDREIYKETKYQKTPKFSRLFQAVNVNITLY